MNGVMGRPHYRYFQAMNESDAIFLFMNEHYFLSLRCMCSVHSLAMHLLARCVFFMDACACMHARKNK